MTIKKKLKNSITNNIVISLTAGTVGSITSSFGDYFANGITYNNAKTFVVCSRY